MGSPTPPEVSLQIEVKQLRDRIAELEKQLQAAQEEHRRHVGGSCRRESTGRVDGGRRPVSDSTEPLKSGLGRAPRGCGIARYPGRHYRIQRGIRTDLGRAAPRHPVSKIMRLQSLVGG